jgi:DNA mismatch endonuclease (patch repair protein)
LADIFGKKKRSEIMRMIGPTRSSQELFVRKIVSSLGYRFGSYSKKLPGKPDLALPKFKKVIFVNGCFWHGHRDCKRSKLPATNRAFWKTKISNNIIRDKTVRREIRQLGWKQLVVWQCEIGKLKEEKLRKRILKFVTS